MGNCKLLEETDTMLAFALTMEAGRRGVSLCEGCCYDVTDCKHSGTIHVDCVGYKIIDKEQQMPVQKAWCKNCSTNTSKPIYYVNFHGRRGVAVECTKCHDRYVLYENMYIERYVGRHTQYGYIPPTYGKNPELPKDVRNRRDKARSQREKDRHTELAKLFGYTEEEYTNMRNKWKEDERKRHIRFEQELAESRSNWEEEARQKKSAERKRLIEAGIIVYNKKAGCLIDTRDNSVVKL